MDFEPCSQCTHSLHKQVGQLGVQWDGLLDLEVNEMTFQMEHGRFEPWAPPH